MKVVVFLWRNGEFEVYGWSLEMGFERFEWKYLCCRDYG